MPRNDQFEKQHGLDDRFADTRLLEQEKQQERSDDSQDSQQARDAQQCLQIPTHRFLTDARVVVSNRQDGQVIEQRQQDDHQRSNWIKIEHDDTQCHEQDDANGFRDAKRGITLHALESNTRLFHCFVNDTQAGGGQDNIRRRPRCVGSV